ncbi:MAG: hypothetical protein ACRDK9_04805 [Solirubrobacterales bacterium]
MRGLPLWLRWALTLVVFGALSLAALRAIQDGGGSSAGDAAALLEASRDARMVIVRDQAPRSAALAAAVPGLALERAIRADVRGRVRRNRLAGPAQSVRCTPAAPGTRQGRRPFRCVARAGGIRYPFRAVVDLRSRRMTWCKFDPVPSGTAPVPLSARCGA